MYDQPEVSVEDVIRGDGRYPLEAFSFLNQGLAKAVKERHGDSKAPHGQRHVTGPALCMALRDLAVERWGMLARLVLARWNIHATIDFGNMVYLLIAHDLMRKTDEDSLEDFRDVFDFDRAFKLDQDFQLIDER